MNVSVQKPLKVYLLTGKARSGKNTVATQIDSFLHLNTGCSYWELALAHPLHSAVSGFFGGFATDILGKNKESDLIAGMSPRKLMQDWGAYAREHDPEVFCKMLKERIRKGMNDLSSRDLKADVVVVITDCRYDNEVKYFKERYDATCIEVVRPASQAGLVREHHSENGVSPDLIDRQIWNDGDLDDLYYKTRETIKETS